jgi:hypothetical protein
MKKPLIITALYNIGRDSWNNFTMSYNTYLAWMENTLHIDREMVVFTEEKFIDKIKEFRSKIDPEGNKTTYIIEPLEELYAYKRWNHQLEELQFSDEFKDKKTFDVPEMNEPLYNIIMFNKLYWLQKALEIKPSFTHLIWLDAGGIRVPITNSDWPDHNKIPDNQILHFSHKPSVEIDRGNEWYAMSQVRHIQGTAFVVPSTKIHWYAEEVARTVDECIAQRFIGSDEKMFDLTYVKQDPSKFHLEVQSWREYYDWFL